MTLNQIEESIKRTKEVGLYSLVSSDSLQQAVAVSNFGPDIIAAEPPELIDQKKSIGRRDSNPQPSDRQDEISFCKYL